MMTIGLGSFNLMVLGMFSGKAAGERETALEIVELYATIRGF